MHRVFNVTYTINVKCYNIFDDDLLKHGMFELHCVNVCIRNNLGARVIKKEMRNQTMLV